LKLLDTLRNLTRRRQEPDLAHLRANLEGPQGVFGPNCTVLEIRSDGYVSRHKRVDAAYQVTIRKFDGTVETRRVSVRQTLTGDDPISVVENR